MCNHLKFKIIYNLLFAFIDAEKLTNPIHSETLETNANEHSQNVSDKHREQDNYITGIAIKQSNLYLLFCIKFGDLFSPIFVRVQL